MKQFLLILPIIISFLYTNSQTFNCGTSVLIDTDGYQYQTVLMGSRCWTKENIRTTHYANGQPVGIPQSKSSFHELINMPGKLQVSLNLLNAENINIDIYNIDGKKVYSYSFRLRSGCNIMDFDIGPMGLYLITLTTETIKSTFKVLGVDQSIIEVKSIQSLQGYKSESYVFDPNPRFYYDYDNDPANGEKFGKLYTSASALNVDYNWTVTLDKVIQGICPNGWHVSNDTDWMQLELYKGMTPSQIAIIFNPDRGTIANTLKTSDIAYWLTDYGTGDLEFSARGAGLYKSDGGFINLKNQTNWLTYSSNYGPMIRNITSMSVSIIRSTILPEDMGNAYSVRCVKDY